MSATAVIAAPDLTPRPSSPPLPAANTLRWPLWQRVAFRFLAIYFTLRVAPWGWLYAVPGADAVLDPYFKGVDWAVRAANARLFHVRESLVAVNGSGDTSWAWAQLWLYLAIALLGTGVWSALDARRAAYPRASYWLRTMLRYYVASAALTYGLIKLFPLQMAFPSLSQLATPLGDFLPMRFSWMFIGYSTPYQVFSGVAETAAGLLLLPRRTVTLGLIAATAAFVNVVMINLAYDVPVKLYSSHLLASCIILLAFDARRLVDVLALNRAATPTHLYEPPHAGVRWTWAHRVLKATAVLLFLVIPAYQAGKSWRQGRTPRPATPLAAGVYDVTRFVVNGDTLPPLVGDTVRWRDVIVDNSMQGSVGSTDTLFWQRYRRGYFRYKADTARRTLAVWRTSVRFDSIPVFTARYELQDSTGARLWTTLRGDSLFVELRRSDRHFQLAERQFHWLSEYNR